jgi:hypothetical protein
VALAISFQLLASYFLSAWNLRRHLQLHEKAMTPFQALLIISGEIDLGVADHRLASTARACRRVGTRASPWAGGLLAAPSAAYRAPCHRS